jgi:ribulose-phosphate 3-epimerase
MATQNNQNSAVIIAPSILSGDFTQLGIQIKALENGGADWVHIDVMDGLFAPNISFGPLIVEACRKVTDLPLDIHLMIVNPGKHLKAFANVGATGITVQAEACPQLNKTLQAIRRLGCKPGVALKPGTSLEIIAKDLHLVDLVLVLSDPPGFSGERIMPSTLSKIEELAVMLDKIESDAIIQLDGGVTKKNILFAYRAGARAFVSGSIVSSHLEGISQGISELKSAVNPSRFLKE